MGTFKDEFANFREKDFSTTSLGSQHALPSHLRQRSLGGLEEDCHYRLIYLCNTYGGEPN